MDGGVPVLSYQIEMLQDGFDQWQPIVQQPRNYFVVKTLEPSTSYRFRVSAVNEYGFSPPSEQTDLVVTKGKGLLNSSPSFKKSNLSAEVKGKSNGRSLLKKGSGGDEWGMDFLRVGGSPEGGGDLLRVGGSPEGGGYPDGGRSPEGRGGVVSYY